MNVGDYEYLMGVALSSAEEAYRRDEVPVGALVIDEDGKILSRAHNERETKNNPCAHAEVLAMVCAAEKLKSWRLTGCELVVTLEPCPMCLAAALQARVRRVVFGAYDAKGGSLSLQYNFYKDARLNHSLGVVGGIRHYECGSLLSRFFREKRHLYKTRSRR